MFSYINTIRSSRKYSQSYGQPTFSKSSSLQFKRKSRTSSGSNSKRDQSSIIHCSSNYETNKRNSSILDEDNRFITELPSQNIKSIKDSPLHTNHSETTQLLKQTSKSLINYKKLQLKLDKCGNCLSDTADSESPLSPIPLSYTNNYTYIQQSSVSTRCLSPQNHIGLPAVAATATTSSSQAMIVSTITNHSEKDRDGCGNHRSRDKSIREESKLSRRLTANRELNENNYSRQTMSNRNTNDHENTLVASNSNPNYDQSSLREESNIYSTRIRINVSGLIYETYTKVLDRLPYWGQVYMYKRANLVHFNSAFNRDLNSVSKRPGSGLDFLNLSRIHSLEIQINVNYSGMKIV